MQAQELADRQSVLCTLNEANQVFDNGMDNGDRYNLPSNTSFI